MRCRRNTPYVSGALSAVVVLVMGFGVGAPLSVAGQPDILLADFEGETYAPWTVEGEAFGPGPARGTLDGQMSVSGYEGTGLVNTFYQGDKTTGKLTSPPFTIERSYINFLIGGGEHPGETCINLLVDGKVIRTATGPNDRPGGTERLDWHAWPVAEFIGRQAVIQIVDEHTGGWGHINIDHIAQTDRPKMVVETVRWLRIDKPYLAFRATPAQAERSELSLVVAGKPARRTEVRAHETSYWMSWDVERLEGELAELRVREPLTDDATPLADSAQLVAQPRGAVLVVDRLYRETYRPQFHFTARKNWLNDPNGLVYYDGTYHLFFQHNPDGINWGNMTWGHAISPDLVHWKQLDHAIHPDDLGTIYSGSAVVDWHNTSGFGSKDNPPLIAFYTSAGAHAPKPVPYTQSIAYSIDGGMSWHKYDSNPVLGHIIGGNRDPKVIWYAPEKKWVMALFLEGNHYALFESKDFKQWRKLSDVEVPGAGECPDIFELPVDDDPHDTRWVFWGGNGRHLIGRFDGKQFHVESGPHPSEWGPNYYAAQTYSDIPASDGRRIQFGWMRGGQYPGMPFNQQMSVPRVLTLRNTPDGVRLFMNPAREVETLREKRVASKRNVALAPGHDLFGSLDGDLWEIDLAFNAAEADQVVLSVRGHEIVYDRDKNNLTAMGRTAPLPDDSKDVRLRVLVDRTSIELFANDGRVVMSLCFVPDLLDRSLTLTTRGGQARIVRADVWALGSAWPQVEQ